VVERVGQLSVAGLLPERDLVLASSLRCKAARPSAVIMEVGEVPLEEAVEVWFC
jgi:hypothetical protein